MMKQEKYMIFLLLIFCSLGCKKYEEGPLISFRSKTERVAGWKRVIEYKIDKVDSLSLLEGTLFTCPTINLNFTLDDRNDPEFIIASGAPHPSCTSVVGKWDLQNHNKLLQIGLIHLSGNWTIERLTYEDLWLVKNVNDKFYDLKLQRIE